MFSGIHYITSKNPALNAFTGLCTSDLYVLETLYYAGRPLPYELTNRIIVDFGYVMNRRSFNDALTNCVDLGYISKQSKGKQTLYSITSSGKVILNQFNERLEAIVKEKLLKYSKGL